MGQLFKFDSKHGLPVAGAGSLLVDNSLLGPSDSARAGSLREEAHNLKKLDSESGSYHITGMPLDLLLFPTPRATVHSSSHCHFNLKFATRAALHCSPTRAELH